MQRPTWLVHEAKARSVNLDRQNPPAIWDAPAGRLPDTTSMLGRYASKLIMQGWGREFLRHRPKTRSDTKARHGRTGGLTSKWTVPGQGTVRAG